MRKQKVTITIQAGDEAGDVDFICDSHVTAYNDDTKTFKVTFVNGVDEQNQEVLEVLIHAPNFVARVTVLLPEEESETVTISKEEYEGLKETIAILSDKDTRDELTQAEADVIAGSLVTLSPTTDIIVGPRSF